MSRESIYLYEKSISSVERRLSPTLAQATEEAGASAPNIIKTKGSDLMQIYG